MAYRVTVARSTPRTVLELRRTVRADHAGEDIDTGMRALYEFAASTGLVSAGPPSTTYLAEFGAGASTEVDFTLPVTAGFGVETGEVCLRRAESRLMVQTTHQGDYQRIGAAYQAIDEWLSESEYQPIGPPTEVYLIGPEETVSARDLLTEIRIPVALAELAVRVGNSFEQTVAQVREVLTAQGFDVLSEIDVRAALPAEGASSMEGYVILGVCDPHLARQALEVDRAIGLLLPSNVVVRAEGHATLVEALDPDLLVTRSGQPALGPIAAQIRRGLSSALRLLAERSAAPASTSTAPPHDPRS
ncbi:DUF302 domain-containing protein [Nocardia sp. NPDC050793]|uniref:DUF302 domain-containing protein n=1 Tax=Nocardia sp. NPDC050793 TaxID=3155159 RepID=UPI0033D2C66E